MMRSVSIASIESQDSNKSIQRFDRTSKAPALVARSDAGAHSTAGAETPLLRTGETSPGNHRVSKSLVGELWNVFRSNGRAVSRPMTASQASRMITKALELRTASQGALQTRNVEEWPGLSPALPERNEESLQGVSEQKRASVFSRISNDEELRNLNVSLFNVPLNPCSMGHHHDAQNEMALLRWQHLFPEAPRQHLVKWWSMTSPACMPLTTHYMPPPPVLATQWQEYPHTISVFSDMSSLLVKRAPSTSPALAVLREMTVQRLSQGFQFVVAPPGSRDGRSDIRRHPSELLRPGNFSDGTPILLSTPTQIHRIEFSRQTSTIDVKRYIARMPDVLGPYEYHCCVWPRNFSGYQSVNARFECADPHRYNWNYLDSLIAGYEESLHDSLMYWRARFVVVPSEGSAPPMTAVSGEMLSDEEIRLQGADKLAELFARAEYHPPGHKSERKNVVRFLPTTLDPSSSLYDAHFMSVLSTLGNKLSRPSESAKAHRMAKSRSLDELAAELRASKQELRVHDRLWHRALYPNSFTGTDLVTWLCNSYADMRTREDAVELGTSLLTAGHIEHVLRRHGFLDGHFFYRLKERPRDGEDATSGQEIRGGLNDAPAARGETVRMSRTMVIDLDPGNRSEHAELAVLHHDLAHNPDNGFNFQIHWLGATARLIEDLVQGWARIVERYGLRLVEAPIGQIKDVTLRNPFEAPLPIKLAINPPAPEEYRPLISRAWSLAGTRSLPEPRDEDEQWLSRNILSRYTTQVDELFEMALLRRFGFVLDQEASSRYPSSVSLSYMSRPSHMDHTQYVHRSGVAFVQIKGGGEFLWLNNRLFTSHTHQGRSVHVRHTPPNPDGVRLAFQQFCADRKVLGEFYNKVWSSLMWLASNI